MAHFLKVFLFCAYLQTLTAKDLGVRGHYFPIEETSLLDYLKERLQELSEEKLEALNNKITEHYLESFKKPKALNLKRAKKYEVHFYDPTVILEADIKNRSGDIIISQGTSYNPLKSFSLRKDLLFFDGNNRDQLKWARENKGEWILTSGTPIELENIEKRPVYFDQGGYLVKKLGIEAIPAKVSQEGLKLKIEQIPLEVVE